MSGDHVDGFKMLGWKYPDEHLISEAPKMG